AAERRGAVKLPATAPVSVRISAAGYQPLETTLTPGDKPTQAVQYVLQATPGQLFVESQPPAVVFLNGERVGRTPLSGHAVDVTRPVKLRLEAPGHQVLEEVLHFGDQRTMTLSKQLAPL
ncbi:MAG: PEGA domain-containing protein, partial [Myxococcales bacterium]|nr:PEGA domain-containing protein [Myxococcales bacterium]